jgi:hypothetical protein
MAHPSRPGLFPPKVAPGRGGVHPEQGEAALRPAAEYRKEAEEYVRLSERLTESHRRTRFLEMAQACLRLADQSDLLRTEANVPRTSRSAQPQYYTGL